MIRALTVLLLAVGLVLIGPLFIDSDPFTTHPDAQLQPPGPEHPFGTDLLGRDVLSRVIHGGRSTLLVAVLATFCSVLIGLPLGIVGGIGRFQFDLFLINTLLAIPGLVIAMVILTLMGRGTGAMVVAMGVSQAAPLAYVTRSAIRLAREMGFVDAAISLGASPAYVLIHHVLPGTLPTVLAYLGVIFSYVLLNGAALSFLGLGNEPGTPDWGVMLAEGRAAFRTAPWIGLAPGMAITLVVWSVNTLVDELSSRPSPRT